MFFINFYEPLWLIFIFKFNMLLVIVMVLQNKLPYEECVVTFKAIKYHFLNDLQFASSLAVFSNCHSLKIFKITFLQSQSVAQYQFMLSHFTNWR